MKDCKENLNENGEPETAPQQDVGVAEGRHCSDVKDVEKLVGVKLGVRHRAMLGEVLDVRRRTFRAQVELWIEFEHLMIERDRMMAGVA